MKNPCLVYLFILFTTCFFNPSDIQAQYNSRSRIYRSTATYPTRLNPVHQNNLRRVGPSQSNFSRSNNLPSTRYQSRSTGFGPSGFSSTRGFNSNRGFSSSRSVVGLQFTVPARTPYSSGFSFYNGARTFGGPTDYRYGGSGLTGYQPYGGYYGFNTARFPRDLRSPYNQPNQRPLIDPSTSPLRSPLVQRAPIVQRSGNSATLDVAPGALEGRSTIPNNSFAARERNPFQPEQSRNGRDSNRSDRVITLKAPNSSNVVPTNLEAERFQAQAEQTFKSGRYDEAARWVAQAISKEPTNGKLHLFSAQTQFALGDFNQAMRDIDAATKFLPRQEWGFVISNYKQVYKGDDFVQHMDRLNDHIDAQPDDFLARGLRSFQFGNLGYDQAATADLVEALQMNRNDVLLNRLRPTQITEAVLDAQINRDARKQQAQNTTNQTESGSGFDSRSTIEGPVIEGPTIEGPAILPESTDETKTKLNADATQSFSIMEPIETMPDDKQPGPSIEPNPFK